MFGIGRKLTATAFIILLTAVPSHLQAQAKKQVYTNAATLYTSGKMFTTVQPFQRVDTVNYKAMPAAVKRLYTYSAGLAVCFSTNSTSITAKWCVNKPVTYPNLTPIASKGLDLYVHKNGKWQYSGVGRPDKDCSNGVLVENMDNSEKSFTLYLPIYSELSSLEIGIDSGSYIKSRPETKKRVLVYGSSITEGASASRPGLAYPAALSRRLGFDFINAGVSGSAKMEPAVIAMLNDVKADAYILDCIPNSSDAVVKERALNMIKAIQAAHPGKPIIMLNSIVREQSFVDAKVNAMVKAQNMAIDSIAHNLLKIKTKDFYYLDTNGFLGDDHEGSTDGIHPNDLGSFRFVEKLQPLIEPILRKYLR
ncbi:SGNH/GDSL hydrolase family protein [Mucilaginibacter boryungensis]|uniref:SGNH/GDSL hydrolase family protein n=2 Tax=Mucilaginibacter boryungensis TaxID=768480 RepID=A0ABR9XNC1_9SPHI|nr:SGNH/GDSL hydrolase family protein [Mucilaginibacter boryungensis]